MAETVAIDTAYVTWLAERLAGNGLGDDMARAISTTLYEYIHGTAGETAVPEVAPVPPPPPATYTDEAGNVYVLEHKGLS